MIRHAMTIQPGTGSSAASGRADGRRPTAGEVIADLAQPIVLWQRAAELYQALSAAQTWGGKGRLGPAATSYYVRFLRLGIPSARVGGELLREHAIDLAYAAIRELLDVDIRCHYLLIAPEDVALWQRPGDVSGAIDLPSIRTMLSRVKRAARFLTDEELPDPAHWDLVDQRRSELEAGAFLYPITATGLGSEAGRERELLMRGFRDGLAALTEILAMVARDGWCRPEVVPAIVQLLEDHQAWGIRMQKGEFTELFVAGR